MPKIDPFKFIKKREKTELRPNLTGVAYKDGFLYATDAHIMLKEKSAYPKKYEGKVIGKEGKVVSENPLNYESVIPDNNLYRPWRIDTERLKKTIERGLDHNSGIKKMPRYERIFEPQILNVVLYDKENKKTVITIGLEYAKKLLYYLNNVGTSVIWTRADGLKSRPLMVYTKESILLLMPVLSADEKQEVRCPIIPAKEKAKQTTKKTTDMKKSTKKSACSTKGTRKSGSTMKTASKILHAQKEDYQKIFRAEVKKSKDPKAGAKKAGKIYRDRYGATATARWKKALKRAK